VELFGLKPARWKAIAPALRPGHCSVSPGTLVPMAVLKSIIVMSLVNGSLRT